MDKKYIDAPIVNVLVMEDRAQVTRVKTLNLPVGVHTLVLDDVTPLINEGNIQFLFKNQGGIVHNYQIYRYLKTEEMNTEVESECMEEMKKIEKEARSIWHEIMNQCSHYHYLDQACVSFSKQLNQTLSLGNFDDQWVNGFDQVWSTQDELTQKIFELNNKWQDIKYQYDKNVEKIYNLENPKSKFVAQIILNVEVKNESDLELVSKYTIPCALWRAYYTAELEQNQLKWDTCACLWQNTGEDWNDVDLTFSTARPSIGANMALLADDYLQKTKKTEDELKNVQITSRDQEINFASVGGTEKVSDTPPGMNDGGEVRNFKSKTKCSVLSNGKANIIPLESWECEVNLESKLFPEKVTRVFFQSTQVNQSSLPLLAGPVNLIRDGGHVGFASIEYVASNEKFELSWGGIDDVMVIRETLNSKETSKILKKRTHKLEVELNLSNNSEEVQNFKLIERIPISDLDDIDVEILKEKTTQGYEVDEHGLVSWNIEMPANSTEKVRLEFEVNMAKKYNWHP